MYFTVLDVRTRPPGGAKGQAFLVRDNWNDWGEYRTQLYLIVFDDNGEEHRIGDVKIGQFGLGDEGVPVPLPKQFEALDESYFSLGQRENYYLTLHSLGHSTRDRVLAGLRDVAADPDLFARAQEEPSMDRSLLRSVTKDAVRGRLGRLARGDAELSKYAFSYQSGESGGDLPPLDFAVVPRSIPPTNVHVLIGRNGVGKTHTMAQMLRALVEDDPDAGRFVPAPGNEDPGLFVAVVSVSFSAFDPYESLPLPDTPDDQLATRSGRRIDYVGLKQVEADSGEWSTSPKDLAALAKEFVASARACLSDGRANRWRLALNALEADPVFASAGVSELVRREPGASWERDARALFKRLSSGHKVVLITITRLVEAVEERTLVLLDEPEAHLHPPLLSAFVRALSDLLVRRNGVAIVATHSPVVLQEVPRSCAWSVRRTGTRATVERLPIETFGENVGVLTREVFGLEVTQTGFHKMLAEAVAQGLSFEDVIDTFDGQLGTEARSIARALTAARDARLGG